MGLSEEEVARVLAEDAAKRKARTDEVLAVDAHLRHMTSKEPVHVRVVEGRRRPVSAKVAAIREWAAANPADKPEPLRLRPFIERALARVRDEPDPASAVPAVLKLIPAMRQAEALTVALEICCRLVAQEQTDGFTPIHGLEDLEW